MIFIKLYQKCKQLLPSIKSPVTQIKFIRYLSKNISSNFHFRLQSLGATHIPVGRALLREAFIKPSLSRVQDGKNWKNRAVGLQQTQQTHFAGKDGNIVANTNAKKKVNNTNLRGGEKPTGCWRWFFGPSSIFQVGDAESSLRKSTISKKKENGSKKTGSVVSLTTH